MNTRQKRNSEHQAAKLMLEAAGELERAAERIAQLEKEVDENAILFAEFLIKCNASHNGFGGWNGNSPLNSNYYGSSSEDIYHKVFKTRK